MKSDWDVVSLAEVYDFSSGLSKSRSEFGSGHPFLGFKDVFYNSAVPTELKELVQSTEKEQSKCSVRRGDVFLTRTSETMNELGMSCVALKDIPFATFNGFTKRLRPKFANSVVPEYSRYYFRSDVFRKKVNAMATMSTRASLNNEILQRLEIILPPSNDQKAIGHILGTLDEKIELNRKNNETLEEIAKALFKSWFIDFDPVRAKVQGRSTGLHDDISNLFPDSFEDIDLGQIPSGWEVQKLGDVVSIQYGKNFPTKNLLESGFPVFGGNGIIGYHSSFLYQDEMTLMSCRGAASGSIVRSLPESFVTNNSLIMNHILGNFPSQRYVEYFLESKDRNGFVTGSAQPQVTIDSIYDFEFLVPNLSLVKLFQSEIAPITKRLLLLDEQNQTLVTLRNRLLPKLISGQLKIPDTEKMLEEVGI